jgi:hypothetical protein
MVVPVDQYVVVREDRLLCARLAGSFAICISDEVHEAGAASSRRRVTGRHASSRMPIPTRVARND